MEMLLEKIHLEFSSTQCDLRLHWYFGLEIINKEIANNFYFIFILKVPHNIIFHTWKPLLGTEPWRTC